MSTPVLNRKLVLETPASVPDGAGGFVESWQPLGTVWAEVRAGSGREKAGAFTTVSSMAFRITVRGAPVGSEQRPRPDQRFREGTRLFRILAVSESDPRGHYLMCFANEEVAA
ncbi:head-tail adaptor protein [Cognatishimia sp. MH4019]|uniref:head-tail adaptor protein n=1 Tax=Cognatishimia sp. MH4019 TaxID=2854030 RepID=UPI001CD7A392|nr:head-tail adaptor protein [Cognatishimia sp. MH4019]